MDVAGAKVSEVKRFTVDAGHNLDQIESTFTVTDGASPEITVAVGLNKTPSDKGQDATIALTPVPTAGSITQWISQKTNGELGTAVIVPTGSFQGFAEDERNQLVLAKATSGQPLRYYVGAGWSKAGEFKTQADWNAYVASAPPAPRRRSRSPSPPNNLRRARSLSLRGAQRRGNPSQILIMKLHYFPTPAATNTLSTEQLRDTFLIDGLFQPGAVNAHTPILIA